MIQATTLHQRARLPLVLLVALAALALAMLYLPLLNLSGASSQSLAPASSPAIVQVVHTEPATTDTTSCGNGAYVTGDMVGDASPAAIYNTLCGKR